ncbi:4Fe-4S binding protein [Sporotomaculum syntrophicum]|nr:4Fe-4S binding protein [Sporotomaculum syntrophicum]
MMYDWVTDKSYVLNYTAPAFLLAAAIIVLALLGTRFFCGWLCPFGALNDYTSQAGHKILGKNYELPPGIDARLRYFKYFVLFFILVSKILLESCILTGFDPWVAFANLPGLPGTYKEIPFAFLVLLLVIIGAFFIMRFFCRYLCPLGALQGILVGTGLVQLKRSGTITCHNCRSCSLNCPVNIKPSDREVVDSAECIHCLRCVGGSCSMGLPSYELTFVKKPLKTYPYVLGAFTIFWSIFVGIGFIGALGVTDSAGAVIMPRNIYHDGTYYGTGVGFAPGLKVQVEVADGRIKKIDVVEHYETSGYYEEAFIKISDGIIKSQSTEVDAISGATYTCIGLVEAVDNALEKAKP